MQSGRLCLPSIRFTAEVWKTGLPPDRKHGNLPALFDTTRAIDETEFDCWHEKTVLAFCNAEPVLPVGWAAKIVNVYLKTRVYLAGEGRKGLVSVIHPPIDSSLQRGLEKEFSLRPWKIMRIKDIHSYQDDYLPFIQVCRSVAKEKGVSPSNSNTIGSQLKAGTVTHQRPLASNRR